MNDLGVCGAGFTVYTMTRSKEFCPHCGRWSRNEIH
jgi:rRNA maturation protein Nop10